MGRNERRIQLALLDAIIFAAEIYRPAILPESATDCQELFCPSVALAMGEVISIIALFNRRVAGDNVEAESSVQHRRKRIHLLYKSRWQCETGTVCDNELYPFRS